MLCCFDITLHQRLMQLSVFGRTEILLLNENMLVDFVLVETWYQIVPLSMYVFIINPYKLN